MSFNRLNHRYPWRWMAVGNAWLVVGLDSEWFENGAQRNIARIIQYNSITLNIAKKRKYILTAPRD